MRNAPPVSVLCLGRAWLWGQATAYALAAAALAAWAAQHVGPLMYGWPAWPMTLAIAALAFGVVGATATALLRTPATELRWDGQQWWLGERDCTADLMLQAGPGALVRLRLGVGSTHAPTWLAIGAAEAGPAWHGLLVALRSQPRADRLASEGWAL